MKDPRIFFVQFSMLNPNLWSKLVNSVGKVRNDEVLLRVQSIEKKFFVWNSRNYILKMKAFGQTSGRRQSVEMQAVSGQRSGLKKG